jgi:hypothetical protein
MKSRRRVQRPSCMIIASGCEVVKVVAADVAIVVDEVETLVICSPEICWTRVTPPDCWVALL